MRKLRLLLFLVFVTSGAFSQTFFSDYYLPENVSYDSSIPPPSEIIGHEVGEFHISHDRLVNYVKTLSQKSARINLEVYGYTHEKRPLILLTISSKENLSKLGQLKEQRKKMFAGTTLDTTQLAKMPLVIWMGYSVHGNEPSGTNAAMVLVYYLAAAQGDKIDALLSSSVILMDVCVNPDGLQRFSGWVNSHKSKNLIADVNNLEHHEPWPKGRTNHYWFDLNRDWLLLRQPESIARIKKYHEWKPNILTDHHEMGINSTLFFQPGVPSRKHPLTPLQNEKLTEKLSAFHAKALDKQQVLYYSKENFDDFYYGKGSTYPDLNGAIGVLFEQASTRGLLRETDDGIRGFPSTIKNQFTVSLSTLEGSISMKKELLSYQNDFFVQALAAGKKENNRAYIFGDINDQVKPKILAQLLLDHKITLYKPTERIVVNNKTFVPENSFIVPFNQPQFLLAKALFEKRTTFKDSLFYDISSWSMDLAFNLDFEPLNSKNISNHLTAEQISSISYQKGELPWKSKYAYAIRWDQYYAPSALYQLQSKGVRVKVSEAEFIDSRGNVFPNGSLVIPLGIQEKSSDEIYDLLQSLSEKFFLTIQPLESGTNAVGIDLGSPNLTAVNKPNIILVTGEGINSTEAGEIWHLLDYKMDIPVTLVSSSDIDQIDLRDYTTIIFPDGNINQLSNAEKLKNWVQNGGNIIVQNDAIRSLKNNGIYLGNFKPVETTDILNLPYNKRKQYSGSQNLGGAIFNTQIDTSHPLCYGINKKQLPVFKNNKVWLDRSQQSFNNPVIFSDKPLLSGYISDKNLASLKNTAGVAVHPYGKGRVIAFAFNPNFRGFWLSTERLFLNSIFFGSMVKTQL